MIYLTKSKKIPQSGIQSRSYMARQTLLLYVMTLNVHLADYSGQGQCKQHGQLGLWMVSFYRGVHTTKAKLNIKINLMHSPNDHLFYFCHLCLFSVIFAFVRMLQLILHYLLNNSISCHNVTYLLLFSPHSVADLSSV
jgi:hypothetical protein